MRRRTATIALLLALLPALAGCGDTGADSASGSGGGSPSASAGSDDSASDQGDQGGHDMSEMESGHDMSQMESGEDDTGEAGDDGRKPMPAPGPRVEVELEGDQITPNGRRVELGVGDPLRLEIESDRPGELHVHSTPESYVRFPAGESERTLRVEQPGVVEVEEHESGFVVLQVEVS